MLKSQQQGLVDPVIEQLVLDLIREETRFVTTELRTVHRETLVLPVTIFFKDGTTQFAFSRNVSPLGVCLIGENAAPTDEVAELQFYRLNGPARRIVAESRWCKPFGPQYFASGWKFMQAKRD